MRGSLFGTLEVTKIRGILIHFAAAISVEPIRPQHRPSSQSYVDPILHKLTPHLKLQVGLYFLVTPPIPS